MIDTYYPNPREPRPPRTPHTPEEIEAIKAAGARHRQRLIESGHIVPREAVRARAFQDLGDGARITVFQNKAGLPIVGQGYLSPEMLKWQPPQNLEQQT